jgi:hypothetical protein
MVIDILFTLKSKRARKEQTRLVVERSPPGYDSKCCGATNDLYHMGFEWRAYLITLSLSVGSSGPSFPCIIGYTCEWNM